MSVIALVTLATGCGGAATEAHDAGRDALDLADEASADADATFDALGKDTPSDLWRDLGPDAADGAEIVNPCGFGPTFGHTCESNNDCNGGWCITTKDGYACTEACIDCCPSGWRCKEIPAGPDKVFACAPDHVTLCRPCDDDATCNGVGYQPNAYCHAVPSTGEASSTGGAFCATPCSATAPCPAGTTCQALDDAPVPGATFCAPTSGECACDGVAVAQGLATTCTRTSAAGTCRGRRTCAAAGQAATPCDAPEPVAEACNGADDDCDGATDEGLADQPDACTVAGATGECARGTLRCAGGDWSCVATSTGADEVCDGLDNDCDGLTDEDGADDCTTWYLDADHDLFGTSAVARCACAKPVGFAASAGDCDDAHAAAVPGGVETCDGLDNDCDGVTDGPDADVPCSAACGTGLRTCGGGVLQPCTAVGTHPCTDFVLCVPIDTCDACPAAPAETCNGVDDDCDGLTDAAAPDLLLPAGAAGDPDGGGGAGAQPCEVQAGVCTGATKPAALCVEGAWKACDAAAYLAHAPTWQAVAEASCDGLDNDCDGLTDDEFSWAGADGAVVTGPGKACGVGACAGGLTACAATGQALTCTGGGQPAPEICNGVDDDCDGRTDGDDVGTDCSGSVCNTPLQAPLCETQKGVCANARKPAGLCSGSSPGWQACGPAEYAVHAATFEAGAEALCDGLDNDCDGLTDEGLTKTWYRDADHDGYGAAADPLQACAAPEGTVTNALDCDDADAGSHPGGTEACNAKDDDCDGVTDGLKANCTNGCEQGEVTCLAGQWSACAASFPLSCTKYDTCTFAPLCAASCPGAPTETCNGLDDDCDGLTDEDQGTTACGVGACAHVAANCADGLPRVCDPQQGTSAEVCNDRDDDCDSQTDEELGTITCGQGLCLHTVPACVGGVSQVCDPLQGSTAERCNGQDDDCDGQTDEAFPEAGATCTVPARLGECAKGVMGCSNGHVVCEQTYFGGAEACDGKDNDCDGVVDGQARACNNGCNWGVETCTTGAWSACNAAPPQCTTGPCCDGCNFRTSDVQCDLMPATTAYRCNPSSGCGGDVERQDEFRYCTGASATCNDLNLQPTGWYTIDSCAIDQPCQVSASAGACGDACALGCDAGACLQAPCPPAGCAVEGPTFYHGSTPVTPALACELEQPWTPALWHTGPVGSATRWTWASGCSVGPVATYVGNNARWQFLLAADGLVNVSVFVPATTDVCSLQNVPPVNRYADGVFYQLDGPNSFTSTSNAVIPSLAKNSWVKLTFSTVFLEAGTYTLTQYDHSNGSSAGGCFEPDVSEWSTRWIFTDQVRVKSL